MTTALHLDSDAIRRAAQSRGVAELALFGSVVDGNFGPESDVDFLVDFLPGRVDPLEDFCGLRDDLERIVERDVDVVVKRAIRNPFFRASALAHAEIVYVADV